MSPKRIDAGPLHIELAQASSCTLDTEDTTYGWVLWFQLGRWVSELWLTRKK